MTRSNITLMALIALAALVISSCGQASPAPTSAPAPTAAPKAAEPTKAAVPAAQPTTAPTAQPAAAAKVKWPESGKSITIVCGWSAGGSADLQARTTATFLEKELGVPVQVVNKTGANGQLAVAELLKAKPDGYTIASSVDVNLISNYLDASRGAAYGRKDIQPIANQLDAVQMIAVKSDGPYKSAKDFIEAAKAKPETVKLGTTGIGADTHLLAVLLQNVAGVKFSLVHFDGIATEMPALLGGHIDAAIGSISGLSSNLKSGAIVVAGAFGKERSKLSPEIPTFLEQGYNVVMPSPRGYVASAQTPKEVVDILAGAIKKVTDSDELKKKFADMGLEPAYLGPADYTVNWDKQEAMLKPLVAAVLAENAAKK